MTYLYGKHIDKNLKYKGKKQVRQAGSLSPSKNKIKLLILFGEECWY